MEADRTAQRLETEARTLAKLLASPSGDKWPRIIDAVKVSRGFEIAFASALGDDLDASTDRAAPAHWDDTGSGDGDPALPEGARPLAEVVEGPAAMLRRLRQVGVVARADGERLRTLLAPGQRLVSKEGDLWRWDGLTNAAEAPSPAARRLAEKNRLGELETSAAAARKASDAARAELDAASAAVRTAAQDETRAFDAARIVRRDLDAVRQRLAAAERRQAEVAARRTALEDSRSRVSAGLDEAQARRADALAQREALPPAGDAEARLTEARLQVAQDRQAVSELRLQVQGLAREAEIRARRLTAIVAERAAWEERRTRASGQVGEIERRQAEIEVEREALREAPDTFLIRRRAVLSEIAEAEIARRNAADELTQADTTQKAADAAASEALAGLSAAREEKARSEARLEAAREKLVETVRSIEERLETTPDGLPEIAGVQPNAPAPDIDAVEKRLEALRQDRERLGAVNLRAEEELTGFETQRDGLVAEKEDLTEAIKRLRAAIGSLNREGRERLLAAFAIVQGHFERLFTSLFGGGTAQLELVESDDPLEAGLEIVARPPGKKPQVMTLLSGGEQALTAIALIFAVFLTNPSPICVLDEVDAPLDDANVERYCDLLREMAKTTETRFIVITHNPITMARMDRLFGVTMAERGVSQLVSVDLEQAEQFLEAV